LIASLAAGHDADCVAAFRRFDIARCRRFQKLIILFAFQQDGCFAATPAAQKAALTWRAADSAHARCAALRARQPRAADVLPPFYALISSLILPLFRDRQLEYIDIF